MIEPADNDVTTALLVIVIILFLVAIFVGAWAYVHVVRTKKGVSVPFGSMPGWHLVLAMLVPWVEIVLGIAELCGGSSSSDEDTK